MKLWKHHAAQPEADKINAIAAERGESFLPRYGGKISSEWMMAKVWQILDEAPAIYERADMFLEATDWVISQMTGNMVRNSCTAGYKAIWHKQDGYPSKAYFKALDPRLENLAETKLQGEVRPLGSRAGGLTETMAEVMGLTLVSLLQWATLTLMRRFRLSVWLLQASWSWRWERRSVI